jgi:hypothetical protein
MEHSFATCLSLPQRGAVRLEQFYADWGRFFSAWPTLEQVFSGCVGSSAQGAAAVSEPGIVFSGSRYPLGLLKANPVDLLVVERGALVKPSSLGRPERWEDMIDAIPLSSRPKMVFESWPGAAVTCASGPSGKAYVTCWKERGYDTTMRLVSAVQVGGAVAQTPSLSGYSHASGEVPLASILSPLALLSDARPMSNLLTPPGLLAWQKGHYGGPATAPDARMDAGPCWRLDSYGAWLATLVPGGIGTGSWGP